MSLSVNPTSRSLISEKELSDGGDRGETARVLLSLDRELWGGLSGDLKLNLCEGLGL